MSIHVRRFVRLVLCVGSLTFFSLIAFAQSDLGRISGFVKDPSGATVPNAKITVQNNSGLSRQTTTNEAGYYTVTNVPAGLYTITAEAAGFQKYQSANNKLDPSSNLAVDVNLVVGAVTQTVEVSAAAVQLQTESASVQQLVTRQQIDALEINGRNPIFMANLVPGTRGGTLANLSFNFSQGPSNINGARTPESLITYDGAPAVRTRSNGTSLGSADVDSTQEIQILTADYAAEYGRSSGGQIRVTSKSGTQTFHGAAYDYVRNTIFNANTWSRNHDSAANSLTRFVTPQTNYNQFGYNIGGPVYIPNHFNTDKTKLFFYWGQEWVRYVFTDSNMLTVPTPLMRTGNFSELLNPNNIFITRKNSQQAKIPVYLADPSNPQASQCGVETPAGSGNISTVGCFPGNIIPASLLSANGLGILKAYPLPNLTTPIGNKNWFFNAKHPQNQRKDTIAIDYNLTDKQQLRLRRVNYDFFEYQPLDGGTNETPKFFKRPNQTNSLNYVWTISPTKVNELLFAGSLDDVYIPVDQAHFLDRTTVGLNYPYIFNDGKLIPTRIPTVNMSSFSQLSGGPYPSHSSGPIFDLSDSFTLVKGNHVFKFGGMFERQGENDNDEINVQGCPTCTNNQNGQFLFSDNGGKFVRPGFFTASTSAAIGNAALGWFDTYSEIGHRAYTIFRSNMYEGFAQDSWKATQKLTLNGGLRYSVIVPYHAMWGNMIVFDPSLYDPSKAVTVDPKTGLITGSPSVAQLFNGMVIPGSGFPSSAAAHVPEANTSTYNGLFHGLPNHYSDIQWNDIQPRLGVAYQITPKTVFRAGGGRFYTRLGVSDSVFLGGNPPFQPNASVSFGSVDNPGGNGTNPQPLVVTTQSKNFRNPEAWNWNFTVERELPWKSTVTAAYVGRRGLHLQRESDINQPTLAVAAANPGVNLNAIRPYKGFSSIRETDNVASSRYNSLQLSWNRRASSGLQFGASYTLSKSMDDGSNQRDVVPDTYDTSMLWGPSEFDARHILVFNYLYPLPFFRTEQGFVGKVLGGWQFSGIVQYQTGTPCSVTATNDYAGVGLDSNFGCGKNGQFWVVNGDPKIVGQFANNGSSDPAQWFATKNADGTSIFSAPPAGTFNAQRVRNIIYQPGFQNWNMGLFKKIAVNERVDFQFRAEAFNVWNHPNWGGSSGGGVDFDPTSSTFGKVTTKGSERNLQLSLRAEF